MLPPFKLSLHGSKRQPDFILFLLLSWCIHDRRIAVAYQEPDRLYWAGIGKTASDRFLVLTLESKETSEVHLLDLSGLTGAKAHQKVNYHDRLLTFVYCTLSQPSRLCPLSLLLVVSYA